MNKIVIGVTGASGSIYAKRLVEVLLKKEYFIHLISTHEGKKVFEYEMKLDFNEWVGDLEKEYSHLRVENIENLFAGISSGSYPYDAMIILPCSMGTLAEISMGLGKNLLTRVADVAIKEKRKLVIVPRETPLSAIHLENMLRLAKLGVTILPAMPGFYHHPKTIDKVVDFIIGKVLDHLHISNNLFKKWED